VSHICVECSGTSEGLSTPIHEMTCLQKKKPESSCKIFTFDYLSRISIIQHNFEKNVIIKRHKVPNRQTLEAFILSPTCILHEGNGPLDVERAFHDMLNDPVDSQAVFRGPSVCKAPFSCNIA
jgi:hypothetical protein